MDLSHVSVTVQRSVLISSYLVTCLPVSTNRLSDCRILPDLGGFFRSQSLPLNWPVNLWNSIFSLYNNHAGRPLPPGR